MCLARWQIFRRPICGCNKVNKITLKTASKNKRTRIYQCLEPTCKLQFSATSGTIFNDSRLPLTKRFLALALIVDAKEEHERETASGTPGNRFLQCAGTLATASAKEWRTKGSADFSGIRWMRRTWADGSVGSESRQRRLRSKLSSASKSGGRRRPVLPCSQCSDRDAGEVPKGARQRRC